jgi:hypothetical protein
MQIYLFILGLGLLLYFVLRKTFIFSYTRNKNNKAAYRFIYTVWVLFLILAWIISIMIVVIHIVYGYFVSFTCFLFFAATLCIMIYFIYQGIKYHRLVNAAADSEGISTDSAEEAVETEAE